MFTGLVVEKKKQRSNQTTSERRKRGIEGTQRIDRAEIVSNRKEKSSISSSPPKISKRLGRRKKIRESDNIALCMSK